MKPRVVDASVVAAAFFQEADAEFARAVLVSGEELRAPELIYAEVANVIWKRCSRGEINAQEARQLLADFLRLPLRITPCMELADAALELAIQTGRSAYDCLYLALAVQCRGVLVSSDRRLVNALSRGPLSRHIAWVGEHR